MNENHAQLLLSRDAILGLHLATRDQADAPVQGIFASLDKVEEAFARGELALEATIEVRVQGKRVRTTVGRALVARCLPETGIPDAPLQRTSVHASLEALCVSQGLREATRASRALETLGLSIVAQGGLSLGMDDLAPAEGKKALVAEARAHVEGFAESVVKGTSSEYARSENSADAWADCTERVWKATTEPHPAQRHDLLFSLVNAQAAGKQEHLRRTLAMPKGMGKPDGYSVELPVVNSLGEGLSAHEHFFDARDIRATTVRTQGRRVRAAAIERRLYRALRGVKLVEDDCGSTDGLRVTAVVEVGRVVRTVRAQAEGLIAAESVRDRFGAVRLPRGARIEGEALDDVTEVRVRSPFMCRSRGGVCRVCSGGHAGVPRGQKVVEDDCGTSEGLRVREVVDVGRLVRPLRAQVEGLFAAEPVRDRFGTVRLPRGARIEGEALDEVTEVWVRWPFKCRSRGGVCRVCSGGRTGLEAARVLSAAAAVLPAETWFPKDIVRRAYEAGVNTRTAGRLAWHNVLADPERVGFRVLAGGGHISIVNAHDARLTERYAVYPDQFLHFADGAEVESGACVAEVVQQRMTLAVLPPGESAHVDLTELPSERGWAWTQTKPVRVWLRAIEGTPSWSPQPIEVGPRMSVKVENLALVQRGNCIAFGFGFRGDVITPPALTLLEALIEPSRTHVERAQLAPCDGIVHVDWARSRVWIAAGASKRLVRIRDLNTLEVQSGDWVACGDALTAGKPSPHDQLRVRGSEWLAASLAERLMREFGLERNATSLLHVGQLVRAMLSRVRVVRPQGTRLRKGVTVTREVWEAANVEASLRGRAPAVVVPVLTPLSVLGR